MFVLRGLTPSGENSVGVEYERRHTDSSLKSFMPQADLGDRGIGTLPIQHVNLPVPPRCWRLYIKCKCCHSQDPETSGVRGEEKVHQPKGLCAKSTSPCILCHDELPTTFVVRSDPPSSAFLFPCDND